MSPRANQFMGMFTVVVVFSVALSLYIESRSLPSGSTQQYMAIVLFFLGVFRLVRLFIDRRRAKARKRHLARKPRREDFMKH